MNELLTPAQMYEADAAAIASGISENELMENAGRVVTEELTRRFERCQAAVLCGPGNNGGDGFVIARLLRDAGWSVRVFLLGDRDRLKGAARVMAGKWGNAISPLDAQSVAGCGLIVDALFGAGLGRPLEGLAADVVRAVNNAPARAVSVDIPSGIDGISGAVAGGAGKADLTGTFFAKKPGHLLMPGLDYCGELVCRDIGIERSVVDKIAGPFMYENNPQNWLAGFPRRTRAGHKYSYGHAVCLSGGLTSTGACRLAAAAALRSGAGLVSVAAPESALAVCRVWGCLFISFVCFVMFMRPALPAACSCGQGLRASIRF